MKKIMFNDKYGLTEAVLQGRKTMTRRLMTMTLHKKNGKEMTPIVPDDMFIASDGTAHFQVGRNGYMVPKQNQPSFHVGEVVAVAQSYQNAGIDPHFLMFQPIKGSNYFAETEIEAMFTGGWTNKMFVRADMMPHQIRITDIKVERMQEISDEDCLKEGIQAFDTPVGKNYVAGGVYVGQDARLKIAKGMINIAKSFKTPQEAFAVLIDRVSGKGTWDANPWVFAYSFELVQKGGQQ